VFPGIQERRVVRGRETSEFYPLTGRGVVPGDIVELLGWVRRQLELIAALYGRGLIATLGKDSCNRPD
jgi:hypothetical protein